jgi:microcompartment protein CcmK/EutM
MVELTDKQAYLAMFAFLEEEYRLSHSDEIGALLGSLSLLADGCPADPAVRKQWSNAVDLALGGNVDAAQTLFPNGNIGGE